MKANSYIYIVIISSDSNQIFNIFKRILTILWKNDYKATNQILKDGITTIVIMTIAIKCSTSADFNEY